MEKCHLTSFDYELHKQKRKTILIKVLNDGKLLVKASPFMDKNDISRFLYKRKDWILKVKERLRISVKLTGPFSFDEKEAHLYLGKNYELSTLLGDAMSHNGKRLKPGRLKKLLEEWYKAKALIVFNKRVKAHLSRFTENRRNKNVELHTKFMKSLWGSCSGKGKITLNTHLIKLPLDLIDYVILHEICHLAVMNHSKVFYRLMDKYMPDWKFRREKIRYFLTR